MVKTMIRRGGWLALFAAGFAGMVLILTLGSAQATPHIEQIFCKIGYHRVLRHQPPPAHYVCVKNMAPKADERPPECVRVHVANADGTHWWGLFCGTGSRGEAPIEDEGTVPRSLIVDGSSLHSGGDCGSYVNPCVFQWAASPAS